MPELTLIPEIAGRVHDVLVELAGARADDRERFIQSHVDGCNEYRFQGVLGFGGKFRSRTFTVDCYSEDMTPQRKAIIEATNAALVEVKPCQS